MSIGKQLSLFDFIENPFGITDSNQTTNTDSIKNLNACIPYKGSKRKISHLILQEIRIHAPKAKYFYDMFGGGGAMALNAHFNGYKTHYNELDTDTYFYMKFLISQLQNKKGKYGILPDEWYRFITKAEFDKIKADKTPSEYRSFVLLNYSFANGWEGYFCNKEKELFKQKGHYLMLDNDKECAEWWDNHFKENGSVVGIYHYLHSEIYPSLNWRERRAYFVDITLKLEAIRVAGIAHLFQKKSNADTYKALKDISQKDLCRLIDKHNPHLPKKNYKGTQGKGLTELNQLQQLQQLEQLQRLEQLQQLQRLDLIAHTNLDYAEVKISTPPQDTIIYADPPYANTSEYKLCGNRFDYERFYQWCIDKAKQGYNVFISEYNMPQDRFKEIWSKETLANFNTIKKDCGAMARPQRVERLFMVS